MPEAAFPRVRRWRRALTWGSLLLVIYTVTTCAGTMLISNQPPFWVLLGMAKVGVFMEFYDRDLPLPAFFQGDDTRDPVPCFRDGAPDPELAGNRHCHPGIHAAEGSHSHTDMLFWWSKARMTGVVMPTSLLESGFVSHRLISYIEEPCRAVRDFDTVIMPHQRAREEARRAVRGGPVWGDRVVGGWIGQEIGRIRVGFDCDGDGRLRPEFREEWMATTFRVHLYDLRGQTVSTIQFTPGWAQDAVGMSRLPRQFPPAAPLDPPSPRSHSSP